MLLNTEILQLNSLKFSAMGFGECWQKLNNEPVSSVWAYLNIDVDIPNLLLK